MPYQINIDTHEITKLTEALRGLHRSSFPNAVRTTLNDLAFDTKQNQLLSQAKNTFIVRAPTMFKKFSSVNKATGWEVGSMDAEAGMLNKDAGKTFNKQEDGGTYGHSYIKFTQTRGTGKGKNKRTRRIPKRDYIDNLDVLDITRTKTIRTRKSRFVADAFMAIKLNKLVLFNRIIMRVNSIKKTNEGKVKINTDPLYTFEKKQPVRVKSVKFVEKSAMKSIKKADRFYMRAVNHEFKKHFK